MRLTLATAAAILMVFANGAAIAEPAPVAIAKAVAEAAADPYAAPRVNNFCKHPGEPCSKVKRDAEAIVESRVNNFCKHPGEPCSRVRRSAEAFAEAMAEPDPAPRVNNFCKHPGEPCSKAKREAEAVAEARVNNFCKHPGEPCSKKRSSNISDEEVYNTARAACFAPGQQCAKAKRAIDTLADAIASAQVDSELADTVLKARDAIAEPAPEAIAEAIAEPFAAAKIDNFCQRPGEPCSKAKRAAEAVASVASFHGWKPRYNNFCKHPGEPCSRKQRRAVEADVEATAQYDASCKTEGSRCATAKRSVDTIVDAAAAAIAAL